MRGRPLRSYQDVARAEGLTMLAVELADRSRRSPVSGRSYTVAEHAVILSTYVSAGFAFPALFEDAIALELLSRPRVTRYDPSALAAELAAAEVRLARDESGLAFLTPRHAAHVYMTRLLELHT